jgi:hypothetical protein
MLTWFISFETDPCPAIDPVARVIEEAACLMKFRRIIPKTPRCQYRQRRVVYVNSIAPLTV